MPDWIAYLRSRFGAGALDDEVAEEVAQHADELYEACLACGQSPEQSRREVEGQLADLPAVVRAARAARRRRPAAFPEPVPPGRWRLVSTLGRDLAHGVRLMAARPAITAGAILTLALGIGANTAIFSVVNAVLLDPLPFPDAERLVMLWEADADEPDSRFIVAKPNYEDWAASAVSFEHTAIWEYQTFNVAGDSEPEQVHGLRVSSSVFPLLGIPPQLGRTFSAAEDLPGHDVAVISDGLWRRRFFSRREAVGASVRLNGRPFEVIGVMPPHFRFTGADQDVWVPIHFAEQDDERDAHSFYAAGRLKPGVDHAAAKAEMDAIGRRLAHQYEENRGETATATPMSELGVGFMRPTLLMLLGAVAFVLLIACANVANLLLVQASGRRREFAVRSALGAGRGRLAAQVMGEGLALAAAGGLAAVGVAWAATTVLSGSLPPAIRQAPFRSSGSIPIDGTVLGFTLLVALGTGLLFSLAPALAAGRAEPGDVLASGGQRGSTARHGVLRSGLMALEVALAIVLLAGAGLMVKSMSRLMRVDPGLDPTDVLVMQMALPQPDSYGRPERTTFCADVIREVSSLPGVTSVAAVSHLPFSGANASRGFVIDGRPQPAPNEGSGANYRLTCPGYFATLGIPIVRGRDFTHQDTVAAPQVAIINEATAARYWPGADPIGQRIKFGDLASDAPWFTIVGVVRDVRHFGLDSAARRELFRPYSQAAWPVMTITIRTAVEPLSMASPARSALRRVDPGQPVSGVRTMREVIGQSVGSRRFPMQLLAAFAVVALLLAIIGVYGVVSCLVSQRTREIGIRMALGARRASVQRLVVGRALVPIAAGVAAGVSGALLGARRLQTLLFEVDPGDPWVLAAIASALGAAAILASWVPARRASGVDPLRVLRAD